ncbi:hypothetical protein [Glycomyces tenuis]|uniref:hypothetical protein n=1 Tax=Glycomyces tenuis TaxID=58116 RepID=UPI0003F62D26|nr:hypothetical protein [Glycomyces tenuis]
MLDFDLRMVLQIAGALLCVANYLLIQTRRITATQPTSLLIVASGGVILLASAIMGADWGLIILEVSWLVMVSVTLVVRHREAVATAAAGAEASGESAPVGSVEAPAAVFDMGNTGELELVGAGR